MNTVLNSYGQLYGCPEILKKSYKFFCRGLDIRVSKIMDSYFRYFIFARFIVTFYVLIFAVSNCSYRYRYKYTYYITIVVKAVYIAVYCIPFF